MSEHSHSSDLLSIRYVEYVISKTLEISLHAIVQGFCKFDNMSKLPASNILDSGMVSNVMIV